MGAEPSSRPFARYTVAIIQGKNKIGNLGIGIDNGPTGGYGGTGIQWWNGPSESGGWVIAQEVPSNNQPTPVPPSVTASVGFWRSSALTDASFIEIAEYVSRIAGSPQTFATGILAKTWLNNNGYWTNYRVTGTVTIYNSHPSIVVSDVGFTTDFGSTFAGGFYNVPYVGNLPVGPGETAILVSNTVAPGVGSLYFQLSVGGTARRFTNSCCSGVGGGSPLSYSAGIWNSPGGAGPGAPPVSGPTSWVNFSIYV